MCSAYVYYVTQNPHRVLSVVVGDNLTVYVITPAPFLPCSLPSELYSPSDCDPFALQTSKSIIQIGTPNAADLDRHITSQTRNSAKCLRVFFFSSSSSSSIRSR